LSVVEVLEKNEIHICHRMSLEVFSAATSAANLLISQAKIIARHLNNHFGKGICPTHKEMSSLSEGYRESKIGSIKWDYDQGCESNSNSIEKAECITWEVSDLSDDVAARLARELKSRNLQDPNHVQSVEIVVGGDHGGPAFIFGGSVTVKLQDEEAIKFELISCQLMCRKESAGLIEATVLPFLTKGLRTIIDKQLDISCGSDGEITCEFGDKGLKPLLFVTGDLAFQAAALGRESMSPHHCMHCQMKCSQFGNLNHEDGEEWRHCKDMVTMINGSYQSSYLILRRLLMKHKPVVHIMRTRLRKVRRWVHPNRSGCNVISVRNGGKCIPRSLPTTCRMSGIAA
jgi:hypothetical protein